MSDSYIDNASRTSGLEHLQEEALNNIREAFNLPATYGIPTEDLFEARARLENSNPDLLFLHDVRTRGGRFLDAPYRVFVLEHSNWIANQYLTINPNRRGVYLYPQAVILLHENKDEEAKNAWCRKTLIHETLHSVSLYSRIFDKFPNIIRLHRFFIEGITECLVGYILMKCNPECYQGWKTNQLNRCSISYQDSVKLWCSFCQCVGIRDLAEFYLSTQENLTDPWNQLVQSIHTINSDFIRFDYQLDPRRAFNEAQFREICINSFPDFKEIYESPTRCFDFAQIR